MPGGIPPTSGRILPGINPESQVGLAGSHLGRSIIPIGIPGGIPPGIDPGSQVGLAGSHLGRSIIPVGIPGGIPPIPGGIGGIPPHYFTWVFTLASQKSQLSLLINQLSFVIL